MGADILEVCIAHIVDAEDVDVGVEGNTFLDVGVQAEGQFFPFLLGFGEVYNFCTFGLGHCEGAGLVED